MKKSGLKWRDMSGTTLALSSLAILGAAAVVSTPVWIWRRRKRKRTDALVSAPPPGLAPVRKGSEPDGQG